MCEMFFDYVYFFCQSALIYEPPYEHPYQIAADSVSSAACFLKNPTLTIKPAYQKRPVSETKQVFDLLFIFILHLSGIVNQAERFRSALNIRVLVLVIAYTACKLFIYIVLISLYCAFFKCYSYSVTTHKINIVII